MTTNVDTIDDPRLADYRVLSDAELLRRRGLFVAEGRFVVERLLSSGWRVVSLLVNPAAHRALEPLLADRARDLPVFVCDAPDFASLTGFNLHRGCLALAERPAERAWQDVVRGHRLVLVLEDITDAANVGSAFRNAAAFGAGGVLLSRACCDPLYRKAIRTSMGAVLRMPFGRVDRWPGDLQLLKAHGFSIVALTPHEPATDLAAFRSAAEAPLAVLVGSEGGGLSEGAVATADIRVRIPVDPAVDSLNLATATGIALYAVTRCP